MATAFKPGLEPNLLGAAEIKRPTLLSSATPLPKPVVSAQPRKILLVDQGTQAAVHTLPHLMKVNWTCDLVLSIEEAVGWLDRNEPSLVLIDSITLGTEGVAGLVAFRKHLNGAKVPIVLIAAPDVSTELLEACSRCGLDDTLLRPLNSAQLAPLLAVIAGNEERAVLHKSRAPKNVALVGGDYRYLQRLGESLELAGHRLLYAAAGPELMIKLREVPEAIDVLIVDDEPAQSMSTLSTHQSFAKAMRIAIGQRTALPPGSGDWAHFIDRSQAQFQEVADKVQKMIRPSDTALQSTERVPFFCPVEFREPVAKAGWRACFSSDLSASGIFVKTLVAIRPGAPVELKIHLTMTRDVIDGTGVVAWSNPYTPHRAFSYPVGMGIQFLGMSPKRLAQLRGIIRMLNP